MKGNYCSFDWKPNDLCFDWKLDLVLEGLTTKIEDIHRFQVYILTDPILT